MTDIVDQPPPVHRPDLVPVWSEVILDVESRYKPYLEDGSQSKPIVERVLADMRERDRLGRERYGTPLTTNNGRDHLVDAYQEMLDASVYQRAAILEGHTNLQSVYRRQLDDIMFMRRVIDDRAAKEKR